MEILSYDIPEEGPCKDLLTKLMDDNRVFHTEFKKWFEKQVFYNIALLFYDEMRANFPWNEQFYCPNGFVSFTGFIGTCNAYAYYRKPNWSCPLCSCCQITKIVPINCNGAPCCELKVNICMDKETWAVKVTEVATPIPSECEYSEPYNVPFDPLFGVPYRVSKCTPVCTDKYPYNAPAPTK